MRQFFIISIALIISIKANATIQYVYNQEDIGKAGTINVDINQDGLWDVRLKGNSSGCWLVLAYQNATTYTSMKIFSTTNLKPIVFPKGADMNKASVGVWAYSNSGQVFYLYEFEGQNTNYIGLKLTENGKQYCAWIEIYNNSDNKLCMGYYAWEDDNNKCMKAGNLNYPIGAGVEDNVGEPEFSIYPSPACDNLYVTNFNIPIDLSIFDVQGKQLLFLTNLMPNTPISISQLAAGIFIMHIRNKDGLLVRRKFVVQKD